MALSKDFRCVETEGLKPARVRLVNNSGSDMYEGDGFYISGGVVYVLADSNTHGIFGVWCDDVANGIEGEAYISGVFEVAVAGDGSGINFAPGEAVYCASASTVDTGTLNDVAIGYIVDADPASGAARVKFLLRSHSLDVTNKS